MSSLGRRRFLQTLLAASCGAACPGLARVWAAPRERHVVVVGAGLAGLTAALLLEQFGCRVCVLEGRQRVGGRVYTLDDIPGHPEGGANVIGPNYGRVLDFARRFGVVLRQPAAGLPSDYLIDGVLLSAGEWAQWSGNPLPPALRDLAPGRIRGRFLQDHPFRSLGDWRQPALGAYDVSAADFFRRQGLAERAVALIDANNSYGNRLADTSLLSLYRVQANVERALSMGQPLLEAAAGNMRLPEHMAAALRQPVILGQKVLALEHAASTTRVHTEEGRVYEADGVVVALPATALGQMRFHPALPRLQRQACTELRYHKLSQAHLLARGPFWEETGQAGACWSNGPLGRIFTRPAIAAGVASGLFNITVWINGDDCDPFDRLPEAEAGAEIMRLFRNIYPSAHQQVELRRVLRWHKEPFSGGSWAVWRPGQIGKYANALHQPWGNVFFAGEHTAYGYSGMEGAAESGERAALEVLRRLT